MTLCSNSGEANFEEYLEAWHLLREVTGVEEETGAAHPEESAAETEEVPTGPGVQRVQNAFDFVRRQLGKGGRGRPVAPSIALRTIWLAMPPAMTPPAFRRFITDLSQESNSFDGDPRTTPPKRNLDGGTRERWARPIN